jgi:hypothetical protein
VVTKSQPRRLPELVVSGELPKDFEERSKFLEVLNIDVADTVRREESVSAIEQVLKVCARRLLSSERYAFDAHVRAALDPIALHAEKLATLLDPWNLAEPVVRAMGRTRDEIFAIRTELEGLAQRSREASNRLADRNGRGEHAAVFANALIDVKIMLDGLFESLRVDEPDDESSEREAAKEEFIRLCRGRLPAAPAHRNRKKKAATKRAK